MPSKTNRDAQPTRRWLTYPEAAARLGVSERQMRRWGAAGMVPCTKFPGSSRVLFDPAKLDEFVESSTSTPSAPPQSLSR